MTLPTQSPESMAPSPARVSNRSTNPHTQVACQRCKLRKAKCDRKSPECDRCREAGVLCEYARTRRPPGFPVGHRQQLEDKIRRLEGEVDRLHRCNNGFNNNTPVIEDCNTGPLTVHVSASAATLDGVIPQTGETSQLDLGSLTHQNDSHGTDQDSNNLTHNLPSPLPSAEDGGTTLQEKPPGPTVLRTRKTKSIKPPDDLVLSLTSLYFRHIHPWLPFLDIRHIFSHHIADDEPSLTTYAIFGATLQYSQDPRLTQSNRDAFWKHCKRTVMVEALEEPSYRTLEALTVLTLDLSGLTHGPQVWGVLAVAIKMAQQLDVSGSGHSLRTSSAADGPSQSSSEASEVDGNDIGRLFWAIYAIDCYVAITTRHASDLSSLAIQNLFPFRNALWHDGVFITPFNGTVNSDIGQSSPLSSSSSSSLIAPSPQVIFGHQLELLDISKHLHSLYIDFIRFETTAEPPSDTWMHSVLDWSNAMDTWFTQLPSALRTSTGEGSNSGHERQQNKRRDSPLILSLNVYYYALRIYLHALGDFATIVQAQGDHHATHVANFAEDSRTKCIEALDQMTLITEAPLPKSSFADRLGWPFAWALWIGGRYCLASQYRDRPLAPHYFKRTLHALGGLSRYWQVASHYARLLQISYNELHALGMPNNQAAPSDLLLSVVDWRVPSSEVEDRGRVDPILRSSGLAPLEKGFDFYDMEMLLAGNSMAVHPSNHDASYMEMTNGTMGGCFLMPSVR